jgi:hypothetical protein
MSDDVPLTEWQKARMLDVMRLGADRATACHYVGTDEGQLYDATKASKEFSRAVLRAEAEPELKHLGNIHRASQDEKNWRTSAWWLERRARQRLGTASAAEQLARVAELVDVLAGIIVQEVPEAAVQRRLIERLLAAVAGVDVAEEPEILEIELLPSAVSEAPADQADGEDAP